MSDDLATNNGALDENAPASTDDASVASETEETTLLPEEVESAQSAQVPDNTRADFPEEIQTEDVPAPEETQAEDSPATEEPSEIENPEAPTTLIEAPAEVTEIISTPEPEPTAQFTPTAPTPVPSPPQYSYTQPYLKPLQPRKPFYKTPKGIAIIAAAAVLLLAILFGTHTICFHDWQDATCTKPQTCSICGRTKGKALGHDWGEWKTVSGATCTEAEVQEQVCSRCGFGGEQRENGEPLGHDWHDATCTEPKTCSRCNETEGKPLGHEPGEWTTTKEATCTEAGTQETTCTRCGETLTEDIEALGHDFGDWVVTKEATCAEQGTKQMTCSRCGETREETIPLTEHTPGDWVTIKDISISSAGSVTPGIRARECAVCGAQLETEPLTMELTMGQRNALRSANSYLSFMAFSRQGLIDQLEFEGYSYEDAVFAVDHCGADWYEQAALKAQEYLDFMSFSRSGLINQLVFEGFTYEEAEYGVTAVGY